jgi:HTH-type transcriptional regulator, sugar sensing transcriptional regulator
MNDQLTKLLQNTGFTEKEAITYIALSELGSGTVSQIAERAKLKRSIVYIVLEGLIKRGYISLIPDTKISRYVAADPTKIFQDLKSVTANFKDALPSFLAIFNNSIWKPKINYFEGNEGIITVFRETERAKEAYYISNVAAFTQHMPAEVERWIDYFKNKIAPSTRCKQILSDTPQDREFAQKAQRKNVQFKFLPKGQIMDMDISLFDNKVALTSLKDHLFIVVIESKALYNSMKTIFDLLWQQGVK